MSELTMAAMEGTVPETVRSIEIITEEILFYKRQAGSAIIEIGRRLNEAKEQLSHGEWLPWLQGKVDFSERSAQNFMRLAREYEKSAEIADLGASKALALLALPVSERADFVAEKHEVNGEEKSVAEMTGAELKQAIAERDEARRLLEEERAACEGATLRMAEVEEDKAKMAEDMRFLNERLAGLNDEVAEKERELAELRSRPVDVAVQYQTDPKELDVARKEAAAEAEQKMAAKIEKTEKALAKAKEEREKAETEQKHLQARLDAANAKITTITEDAERLRKEAQMAGDKELTAFMIHFEQGQDILKKMKGILQKMDYSGRKETADKLRKALAALADSVSEAARGAE